MQERMAFLQSDLQHLFDDQGVDETQYAPVVTFLDPLTKYDTVQGYMFNIRMLRTVFSPVFELHDIRQTGPAEATTRWTMTMRFTPARALRVAKWWDPAIIFTGTSIYGFNAQGKICRHVDTWDSIKNQTFLSLEALGDFFGQLGQTYTTPPLETPQYTVLRRTASYQVRHYQPFIVAEAPLDPQQPGGSAAADPAAGGGRAFNALAGYIFGRGNLAGEKLGMTTPVLTNTRGAMQFMIPPSLNKGLEDLPAPVDPSLVATKQVPGGIWAVRVFSGMADSAATMQQLARLQAAVKADGLEVDGEQGWTLARFNDPSTPALLRRNEVLLPLKEFDLWR